jgi:hypothetical protein
MEKISEVNAAVIAKYQQQLPITVVGNTYPIDVTVPNDITDFSDNDMAYLHLRSLEIRMDVTPVDGIIPGGITPLSLWTLSIDTESPAYDRDGNAG